MIWELVNVTPGPDGRGRTTYKDEHGNQITLSGHPEGVSGVERMLAQETEETRRARNSITGGALGALAIKAFGAAQTAVQAIH